MSLAKKLMLSCTLIFLASVPAQATIKCADSSAPNDPQKEGAKKASRTSNRDLQRLLKSPEAAWGITVDGIRKIQARFEGTDYLLQPLLAGIIAKEFGWLNGDPGGAKTLFSRTLFQAELRTLSDQDKKIFLLQFHKLLNEGVITGFPNLKKMLDNGEYERNIDNSLIADKFVFFIGDEIEKATPALQATLLSVLNERKAFLGSEVVETMIASGVFTSNKTTGELVESAGDDRAAIEALLDRMGIKVHVINQAVDAMQKARLRRKIEWTKKHPEDISSAALHLSGLTQKVRIPKQMIDEMTYIIEKLDSFYNAKVKEAEDARKIGVVKAFFPPNQFSNRSVIKLLSVWKSAFIAKQLMEGIPYESLRFDMRAEDLKDLSIGSLLNGPGQFREKTVKVEFDLLDPDLGTKIHRITDAALEPHTGKLYFRALDGSPLWVVIDAKTKKITASSKVIDSTGHDVFASQFLNEKEIVAITSVHLKPVESAGYLLEDDGILESYLKLQSLPARTREELEFIHEARIVFLNAANHSVGKLDGSKLDYDLRDERAVTARLALEARSKELEKQHQEIVSGRTKIDQASYFKFAAETIRQSFRELRNDFKEMDHSITAHFVSILARTHLFSYGPPGGAKTALANTILAATLKTVNTAVIADFNNEVIVKYNETIKNLQANGEKYEKYELFFRQFHKMVPEGEITGFPKLNEQLESGTLAYDRTNSLSHQRFLFAILDEVEKGNPALLQTLLSILNEREVFAGHETVKASLATAVLTSNKVPFEMLDFFGDDFPTGLALLDRTINKNLVMNKLSNREALTSLLLQIQSGSFKPGLTSPLMLVELQPLLAKVHIPERVELFMLEISGEYLGSRLSKEEETKQAYNIDPLENPNYYVPATKPSNRSENANMDQLKASWLIEKILDGSLDKLIDQNLAKGQKFEDMQFEFKWDDVHLLAQGLVYWGPYKIVSQHDTNGILTLKLQDQTLRALENSSGTTPRLRYQLQMIRDEAEAFVQIVNRHAADTIKKHRDLIGRFPSLFPGLFKQ